MQTRLLLLLALCMAIPPHAHAGAGADRPSRRFVQPTSDSEHTILSSMLSKPNRGTVEIPSNPPAPRRLPHRPTRHELAEE
jgi:hypothetical protein